MQLSESEVLSPASSRGGAAPDNGTDLELDIIEELAALTLTGIDIEGNMQCLKDPRAKFGKFSPRKDLIDIALEATDGNSKKIPKHQPVSRKDDRPPPVDEPGRGEVKDQDCQGIHEAKHQPAPSRKIPCEESCRLEQKDANKYQQQERHQTQEREDWWKIRFITPSKSKLEWSKVYRRLTIDRDTRELLEDVRVEKGSSPKDYECKPQRRRVPEHPHHILLPRVGPGGEAEARRRRDILSSPNF